MSTISITLNGDVHTVAQGLTLEAFLHSLLAEPGASKSAMATAVNSQHVARQARANVILNDQDVITTFEPIGGG